MQEWAWMVATTVASVMAVGFPWRAMRRSSGANEVIDAKADLLMMLVLTSFTIVVCGFVVLTWLYR